MYKSTSLYKDIFKIALPVTIQSVFQSTLTLIDQVMVGSLGAYVIAGIGQGGKFCSLYTVIIAAVATAAGILISQYCGSKNNKGISDSFFFNLYSSLLIGIIFTILGLFLSNNIMSFYAKDIETISASATYLKINSCSFIPMAITLIVSALLRNIGYSVYPMISSIVSVLLNTLLNYVLIYGVYLFPKMGLEGAALATVISRIIECALILVLFIKVKHKQDIKYDFKIKVKKDYVKTVGSILIPILICEFLWSLGENVYAIIYGKMTTDACAAMTLTNPIQGIMIGLLCGLASASGIIIGKELGEDKYEKAYNDSKLFMKLTFVMSIILSAIILISAKYYVLLFNVSDEIRKLTIYIFYGYAVIFNVKVFNMVLGGGILRSGGKTKYMMILNAIGTWIFGVPLGLLSAYVFELPIYYVYIILSMEEVIRMLLEVVLFKSKKWMNNVAVE